MPYDPTNAYTSLADVRAQMKLAVADTASDTLLTSCVERANAFMVARIGAYLGPSSDTIRTYDTDRGDVLWIRDGIRTCTLLEMQMGTGAGYTTVGSSSYFLRPLNPMPGRPYDRIVLSNVGGFTFQPALAGARVTGTFGYAEVDPSLNDLATSVAVRLFRRAQSGEAGVVSVEEGFVTIPSVLSAEEWRTIGAFKEFLVR